MPSASSVLTTGQNTLAIQVHASGTQYLGPLELVANTIDWSLEDEGLLGIRSNAHFNRTLPPMEQAHRISLEMFNYLAAIAWLALLALLAWLRRRRRRAYYTRELGL